MSSPPGLIVSTRKTAAWVSGLTTGCGAGSSTRLRWHRHVPFGIVRP